MIKIAAANKEYHLSNRFVHPRLFPSFDREIVKFSGKRNNKFIITL